MLCINEKNKNYDTSIRASTNCFFIYFIKNNIGYKKN